MNPKTKLIFLFSSVLLISLGGLLIATSFEWYPFMWGLFVPSLIGYVVCGYNERKIVSDFLSAKSSRHGLSMGMVLLSALVTLVTLNFIASRYSKTFDLSLSQQFTLSDQSKKILDSLTEDLHIKYFYQDGLEGVERDRKIFSRAVDLFKSYSSKIKVEYVEINSKPALVKEFGASRGSGEVFVQFAGKINRIEGSNEQSIINAIIKSTRKTTKTVYFMTGHGERTIDQASDPKSISEFARLIERNAFQVKQLNLFQDGKIPEDAAVVVVPGPTESFQSNEIVLLKSYLEKGGRLLLFLEDKNAAGLEPLLSILGLELQNQYIGNVFNSDVGSVVDLGQPTVAVQFAAEHTITRMLTQNNGVNFLQPSSLLMLQNSKDIKSTALAKTPEASVALKDVTSSDYIGNPQSFNMIVESVGTLAPASSKTTTPKEFIAITVADVDVISNSVLFQRSNKDLTLNAISYLAGEDDLVALPPKNPNVSTLLLKEPEFSQYFKFIVVGLFLPIPLLFFIFSGAIWARRRNA